MKIRWCPSPIWAWPPAALAAAGFEVFTYVMKGTGHGISQDGLGAALQFLRERLKA